MKPVNYIDVNHPDAFADYPSPKERPSWAPDYVECPLCKGHGGWNLKLNAYPLHTLANTAENRHNFSHFRAHCIQCGGYGWTTTENSKCIHEFALRARVGNCLNLHKCVKCGKEETWDSSD